MLCVIIIWSVSVSLVKVLISLPWAWVSKKARGSFSMWWNISDRMSRRVSMLMPTISLWTR